MYFRNLKKAILQFVMFEKLQGRKKPGSTFGDTKLPARQFGVPCLYIDKLKFEDQLSTITNIPEGDVILSEHRESKDLRTDLFAKGTESAKILRLRSAPLRMTWLEER